MATWSFRRFLPYYIQKPLANTDYEGVLDLLDYTYTTLSNLDDNAFKESLMLFCEFAAPAEATLTLEGDFSEFPNLVIMPGTTPLKNFWGTKAELSEIWEPAWDHSKKIHTKLYGFAQNSEKVFWEISSPENWNYGDSPAGEVSAFLSQIASRELTFSWTDFTGGKNGEALRLMKDRKRPLILDKGINQVRGVLRAPPTGSDETSLVALLTEVLNFDTFTFECGKNFNGLAFGEGSFGYDGPAQLGTIYVTVPPYPNETDGDGFGYFALGYSYWGDYSELFNVWKNIVDMLLDRFKALGIHHVVEVQE